MQHYSPLKFKPIYHERIWGSDAFKRQFGKDLPADKLIGESWELSDLPDNKSVVSEGCFAGLDIRSLLNEHGLAMGFTAQQAESPFGLLIKLLDANDPLSVQVHPDLRACEKFPDARLKTECWYVIDAQENSVIYRGLKPGVSREDIEKSLKNGTLGDLMVKYWAKKGDFYHLPAGTIHALGAGVLIAEIQTPSDTTYRLFDWNRKDSQGHGRALHIERALESINFGDEPPTYNIIGPSMSIDSPLTKMADSLGTARQLLRCDYFNVAHVSVDSADRKEYHTPEPVIMITLSGSGVISNANLPEQGIGYQPGDTIMVPAMDSGCIDVAQPGEFLLTTLGPLKA
ncbi:MAG: class I mannose-6-phosphate isomerase [Phycisphaerae bacterium]|nr:class I mannose-6-phosphate isomerase [Phycisphaerae bacterium]